MEDIFNNNSITKDNSNNYYIRETIYILQYPEGKLSVSYGIVDKISDIKKYHFSHLCSTKEGSSGSPILNISNNKVFGIHKQASIKNNYNKGAFLSRAIKEFIQQNFNEQIVFSKPMNCIEQTPNGTEKREIKKIIEVKDVNEKERTGIKEKKSMTLKEFGDKFKIFVYPEMKQLIISNRKNEKDILEIICNMNFQNLKDLRLEYNNISNINILEKYQYQYQKLEILHFDNNKISDISVFQNVNFPNLKELYLSNNNISDIDVFEKAKFENLEELNLDRNKILDINVLERVNFPKIKRLHFFNNNISDISVFDRVKIENLSVLDLRTNNIDKQKFSSIINKLKKNIKFFMI